MSDLPTVIIRILSVAYDRNPVKQAKGVLIHIKDQSNGLQAWLDSGTETIMTGLPPHSALLLSVSIWWHHRFLLQTASLHVA